MREHLVQRKYSEIVICKQWTRSEKDEYMSAESEKQPAIRVQYLWQWQQPTTQREITDTHAYTHSKRPREWAQQRTRAESHRYTHGFDTVYSLTVPTYWVNRFNRTDVCTTVRSIFVLYDIFSQASIAKASLIQAKQQCSQSLKFVIKFFCLKKIVFSEEKALNSLIFVSEKQITCFSIVFFPLCWKEKLV